MNPKQIARRKQEAQYLPSCCADVVGLARREPANYCASFPAPPKLHCDSLCEEETAVFVPTFPTSILCRYHGRSECLGPEAAPLTLRGRNLRRAREGDSARAGRAAALSRSRWRVREVLRLWPVEFQYEDRRRM
eukprot:893170-Rhodomonas_salina.1